MLSIFCVFVSVLAINENERSNLKIVKKKNMAKTKPTLEDYIFDMETRPPDHGTSADQDLWTQLQKKESDLLLAAELGKALLEKNEELAKQQEKIIEEYSKKLEVSSPIPLI